jgi:alpha-glucosidase
VIHHDGSALYVPDRDPVLGDTVEVLVRSTADAGVTRLWARTTPDAEPRFAESTVEPRIVDGREELWFRVPVRLRNPVTRYRFLLDGPGGYRWLTAAGVVGHDVPDDTDFRIVCGGAPPAWAADAVVYLIFPDRFARSAAAAGRPTPVWAVRRAWHEPVSGDGPDRARELYGGDLDGIRERLDHIAALGANALCLTPFFPSPSNHRYCASSFDEVDPLLGGDEALARLAGAVHERGWRLIGDLTSNHTGDEHPWFRAARAGTDTGLYYLDPSLPYGYETWVGVRRMPKLNWHSIELRRRFFDGPRSVVRRWLAAGLDGWRVDVANTTGRAGADDLTRDVAAGMLRAMTAERPDALLVAENCHDASADLDADGWHATINYAGFTRPVWTWLARVPLPFLGLPVGVPRLGGAAMVDTVRAFGARMSWRSWTTSWCGLDSHDTPRFLTLVDGSVELLEVGVGLMMTLPGTPVVFAGDEIGLTGSWGEDARRPMPWNGGPEWDTRIFDLYRGLIALRRSSVAFRHGGLRFLHVGDDMVVYLRETAGERMLVLAARAPTTVDCAIWTPAAGENVHGGASDLKPGDALPVDGPTFQVWRLEP